MLLKLRERGPRSAIFCSSLRSASVATLVPLSCPSGLLVPIMGPVRSRAPWRLKMLHLGCCTGIARGWLEDTCAALRGKQSIPSISRTGSELLRRRHSLGQMPLRFPRKSGGTSLQPTLVPSWYPAIRLNHLVWTGIADLVLL